MKVLSNVPLYDRSTREFVDAQFVDDLTWEEINTTQSKWANAMKDIVEKLEATKVPKDKWPEHLHWNWSWKQLQTMVEDDLVIYGVVWNGEMQGLMALKTVAKSKIDPKLKSARIEYVSTAPWNLDVPDIQVGKFRQIGRICIGAAIDISRARGHNGRVGLYSIPQSEAWYAKQGMTEVKHAKVGNQRFFEMTPEQAKTYLPEE